MDMSFRLQQQLALQKYGDLDPVAQYRVNMHMDDKAKMKGYHNHMDMKNKNPRVWESTCADTVMNLFPVFGPTKSGDSATLK